MNKLEDIEVRAIYNSVSAEWEADVKWLVTEIKAAQTEYERTFEALQAARAEVKRLSAPVTGDRLRDAISEWHEAELEAGNIVPDFWDECETSERLAAFLKGRMS